MEQIIAAPKLFFYLEGTTTLKQLMEYAAPNVDKAYAEAAKLGLEKMGPIEFVYLGASSDMEKEFTLQIGFPVKNKVETESAFKFKQTTDFKCLKNTFKGPITEIGREYEKYYEYIWNNSMKPTDEIREIYHFFESPVSANNVTEIQIGLM